MKTSLWFGSWWLIALAPRYLPFHVIVQDPLFVDCHIRFGNSLVAQKLKHLPAMWETWVQSLGWEDSPGEGDGNPFILKIFIFKSIHFKNVAFCVKVIDFSHRLIHMMSNGY